MCTNPWLHFGQTSLVTEILSHGQGHPALGVNTKINGGFEIADKNEWRFAMSPGFALASPLPLLPLRRNAP